MRIFPRFRKLFLFSLIAALPACDQQREKAAPPQKEDPDLALILREAATIEEVSFPAIVKATTGRTIMPFPDNSPHLEALAAVLDETVAVMNEESSPVRNLRRINEASRFFEDEIRERLNEREGYKCSIPVTASGEAQRTGYPDLRIEHTPTKTVYYLDPKLYETGSEKSSLRTFYYTPGRENTKILEDAHHLLVGIAHDGNDGKWQFLRWQLVDLAHLQVRLKTEMQASNRDLYNGEGTLRKSAGEDQRN